MSSSSTASTVSLSTSSSSYDDDAGYSQAVISDVKRKMGTVTRTIYLDISILDRKYLCLYGPQSMDTGFTCDGVYYTGSIIAVQDGTKIRLSIPTKPTRELEDSIMSQWVDRLLGRIRWYIGRAREYGRDNSLVDETEYRPV